MFRRKWSGKFYTCYERSLRLLMLQYPADFGGAGRDRTGGLIVANDALSQLSYSPTRMRRFYHQPSGFGRQASAETNPAAHDRWCLKTSYLLLTDACRCS
jgi:hypothetical protein